MNNVSGLNDLQCLRRHLDEGEKLFQKLKVRESGTPKLSPTEARIQKYNNLL